MKRATLSSILQIVVSLSLGVFLIWFIYSGLSETDKSTILQYFQEAHYGWVFFSALFGLLSHMSRAWRWKYTLKPLGYAPRYINSFGSVMVGYLANLAFPRLGEATRCVIMSRYEKMAFDKLFGTVIAERVADLIMLLGITFTAFLLQLAELDTLLNQNLKTAGLSDTDVTIGQLLTQKAPGLGWLAAIGVVGLVGFVVVVRLLQRSQHPFAVKVRTFLQGILEGIKSIWTMKDKGWFLLHTLFIWAMYIAMFYVCFYSLDGTRDVPLPGVLLAFVMGGFSIVLVQGGLGAYPAIMMLTLGLYGINANQGLAFGWITWTAQTVLVLALGSLSFLLLPLYNARFNRAQTTES